MHKLKRVRDISKRKNGNDKITTKKLSWNNLMPIECKEDEKRSDWSIFRRSNTKNEWWMIKYSSRRSHMI
jgi:hypothetical protein